MSDATWTTSGGASCERGPAAIDGAPKAPNYQMMRLRDMLDAEGIAWHDNSDALFCRTQANERAEVTVDGRRRKRPRFSVIVAEWGTYGGPSGLEAWMAHDEYGPYGYGTAEQVMDAIREEMGK